MAITKDQLREILSRPSIAKANPVAGHPTTSPKPERRPKNEQVGPPEVKEGHTGKCEIRIRGFRNQLQDPDNIFSKYAIDQLRYSGVIANDTQAHVQLVVLPQVKVHTKAEERTEIEIEWL